MLQVFVFVIYFKKFHFFKTKARMYFYGSFPKSKIEWKCDRSALMKNILEARADFFRSHLSASKLYVERHIINYFITVRCKNCYEVQLCDNIM